MKGARNSVPEALVPAEPSVGPAAAPMPSWRHDAP